MNKKVLNFYFIKELKLLRTNKFKNNFMDTVVNL